MERFSGSISALKVGDVIEIRGRVPTSAGRFTVDLNSGNYSPVNCGDVQMHLSVRYDDPIHGLVIVRNTHNFCDNAWNEEEREQNMVLGNNNLNPIKRGQDFKLAIYVDANHYFVTINEKPYCTFSHRDPLGDVEGIRIAGDVEIAGFAVKSAEEMD